MICTGRSAVNLKPFPFNDNNWPIGVLPDGTLNVVEKGAPPFRPTIIDDDPFLELDEANPDDEADEAHDRAIGALSDD